MKKDDSKKRPPFRVTFARIISLARPEVVPIGIATFFLLVAAAANLVFPQGIRVIIDQALSSGSKAQINDLAEKMVVIFAVMGVAMALRYYFFMTVGERVVTRLRASLFKSLISQEIG